VGAEPADWQREIHGLVREAQRAGRHALAPDVEVRRVDAAARDVIIAAGYGEAFSHGLGHGVGLEIHEAPRVSFDSDDRLADRTPVTVEPGIYLPGRGGVRIEDTLVVRDGGPELLTTTPKDLMVL
jgi:Xaa-Pro aminopeptidase